MKKTVKMQTITRILNIYLADDDEGDRLLFKDALKELPVTVNLTVVNDGEELLDLLTKKGNILPDVLFLDLNMPRKNGFAALGQIKRDDKLNDLPVIIFTTANDPTKVKMVFRDAAHYYIRKPAKFSELKEVIYNALRLIITGNIPLPKEENFVLTGKEKPISDERTTFQK